MVGPVATPDSEIVARTIFLRLGLRVRLKVRVRLRL